MFLAQAFRSAAGFSRCAGASDCICGRFSQLLPIALAALSPSGRWPPPWARPTVMAVYGFSRRLVRQRGQVWVRLRCLPCWDQPSWPSRIATRRCWRNLLLLPIGLWAFVRAWQEDEIPQLDRSPPSVSSVLSSANTSSRFIFRSWSSSHYGKAGARRFPSACRLSPHLFFYLVRYWPDLKLSAALRAPAIAPCARTAGNCGTSTSGSASTSGSSPPSLCSPWPLAGAARSPRYSGSEPPSAWLSSGRPARTSISGSTPPTCSCFSYPPPVYALIAFAKTPRRHATPPGGDRHLIGPRAGRRFRLGRKIGVV